VCVCDILFSPTMLPSSPVVSLSSDTINQVCRETVTSPDLMDMWSLWQQNAQTEAWPYNALEPWLVCYNLVVIAYFENNKRYTELLLIFLAVFFWPW